MKSRHSPQNTRDSQAKSHFIDGRFHIIAMIRALTLVRKPGRD
jgi:hypothetical protein